VAQAGGAIPGVLRVDTRGEVAEGLASFLVEVPAAEPTLLVLLGAQPGWVDAALVQHVATAAAVEVAARSMRQGHERRRGGELLSQLLDDQLAPGRADAQFAATGLDPAESVLLAVRDPLPEGERDLHLGLTRRGLPYLLLRRGEVLYAVLPDRPAALELLAARLGHQASIGVSAVLGGPRRLPAARREADWALSVARSMPEPIPEQTTSGRAPGPPAAARIARYGDQGSLALLRDLDEARIVVERTLGPLLRYDREHGSDLVGSLSAFLAHRRSWQRTARALGVHKQTVFYRMRRVEQITGRDLAETGDLAELWVALRAMTLLTGAAG
jgi:purine catabolism regulator